MERITKYPRTAHLKGSKMQRGDGDLNQIDFSLIVGKNIVIEEKVDGANTGISFSDSGELLLQSRGHYLIGGYSERHYDLFKKWAYSTVNELFEVLGDRYIMYGEWLYAKHKIYYDSLPNYFLEFDIYDKKEGVFLSTERRKELLKNSPVVSVPVLGSGVYKNKEEILKLLGKSLFAGKNAKDNLLTTVKGLNLNQEEILKESDCSG
ncbi:MAG: RNA ligase family protein, partial [Clostridia bacterium]|nr:RNA ligase family protein [Clostridia bacterium]